ncbi:hypothetical protein PN451_08165 [Dolichospermum planctonicum CS-1226]|uniref:Glycosyltransferase RgtA/B/C/D-like domain-containing protein n=1 Tax=Dolichospermum planctonicum CS-1226 TaxID=3021751 RepID=A0ABT5AEU5_9CYAN|nr:hypothetical protein [Dolichospermum planctonicum]MDB9535812.1 hypothetical protein [Dolichospermum planctonicum CS-1226]
MLKNISYRIFITVFILISLHATPDGSLSFRYTDTVRSLVDFGTFALQKGYRSHVDILLLNNNSYSVIPPGIPILLAPLYWLHRTFMSLVGISVNSEIYWSIFNILTNIFVLAPLVSVVAVIMFKTLNKFTDNIYKQLWLVFIFIFGSLVFFYSTYGIWTHVYTMSFIFIAFYLTLTRRNSFLIGLFLGLAQIVDYIAIIPISLLIGFWIHTKIQDQQIQYQGRIFLKELIVLLMGYSIFLLGLIYYNYIITGSVFKTPNSLFFQQLNKQNPESFDLVYRRSMNEGMFNFPSFQVLFGLTFSPFRGIFLYFPMVFLFIISLFRKNFKKNNVMVFCFIFVAFIFTFNSTYYAWSGDVCFGPRHLVVAIPFIIIGTVYTPLKYIKILGALSIFINLAGVSTVPSNNLFLNIVMFLYKGPFLHWLDYLYKVVLPKYYNIHISLMTPFFIYVVTAWIIYLIWRPIIKAQKDLDKKGWVRLNEH